MISALGNSISFKSGIVVDIGGSTKEGSCKIDVSTNDCSETLYKEKTRVNNVGRDSFSSEKDFWAKICSRIINAKNKADEIIDKKGLPASEKILNKLSFLVPSYAFGSEALYFANLKTPEGPLKNVDFAKIPGLLSLMGVNIKPNLQVKVFQDAIGSGLAMTERLYKLDLLKPGDFYTVAITGGGCGISNIRHIGRNKVLVDSSGSSCLTDGMGVIKVSKLGASAPAIIRNFCKAFCLDEEVTEKIASCGIAEFTMNDKFKVPKTPQGEKLQALLLSTDKYKKVVDAEHGVILEPKPECFDKFKHARYNAINKYAHALARLAVIKENEGSNGLIVTGPLARAIDKSCKNDYKSSLSQWIMDKIDESYNTLELGKARSAYDFKVLCGESFEIDDNTAGRKLLNMAKTVGDSRYNWLEVNLKKLRPKV